MELSPAGASTALPPVVVALMRGVVYREDDLPLWQSLIALTPTVQDYVAVMGLQLILDEAEGYAYLRQNPSRGDDQDLPRLVARRQLSYPVSLLLALLRKRLAELDASGGETRLILSRDQIAEMVRVFLPDTGNEARLLDRIGSDLNKIKDMGFLRELRGVEDRYEVQRILKAFVDAQWLGEFEARLAAYRQGVTPSVLNEEGA